MSHVIESVGAGIRVTSRPATRRPWIRWESLDTLSSVALGLVMLVAVLLYVWVHIHVVGLGYEIERLRERHAALVQENKALRLEMGQLRSLRRVEELARTRLGMVTPKPGQVVVITDTTVH